MMHIAQIRSTSMEHQTAPDSGAAPARRRAWSIARRLTVLYTLSAIFILAVASGFLYWVLASDLREEDNQFIADVMETITTILREHPDDKATLRGEVEVEGPARRYAKYFARVMTPPEVVFMETPGMNEALPPPDKFPPPAQEVDEFTDATEWRSPAGRPFLLAATWAPIGTNTNRRALIQMGLEVRTEDATLANYRRWLALVLGLGILGSAAAGLFITRRGLRPVEAITAAAQRVTAAQLNARISRGHWPVELTTLASEFDKMLARLEESFTRLSQFSADLAHELRTPINNLMGSAEVALARSRTPEEYREVLESGLEEYNRLSRMIDSLLFLARAENVETKIQKVPLDAVKEIQSVLEFYEPLSAENSIELDCPQARRQPVETVTVNADSILFRRVLGNLVSNALQYTPRSGRVTISAQNNGGQWAEVRVSDTGCGIPSEHLPKVFDRFYRIDPARAHHPQGTGLGLAIVKSIMDLHAGTVTVESRPGQGATFTLRFPAESTRSPS
jgi:two-component system heavy metal sensor histidine kinase CusS